MAKLVVFRGDAVECEMHVGGQPIRIGRDDGNEIVLDDKSVSRFHAEVRSEAGGYFIVDLKSRNGIWLNGQQIKKKAPLALGVPMTLGAYELALEDDVATGEFDAEEAVPQRTVVSTPAAEQVGRPSRSATRVLVKPTSESGAKGRRLVWSGVAAALLIGAMAVAVVMYRSRSTSVATVDQSTALPAPSSVPTVDDLNKAAITQHLADARVAMEARDYAAALRDHLLPVLALDPGNQEALELKGQADQAQAATPPQTQKPPQVVAKAEAAPKEVETPGISRRANEAWADYSARVTRIQTGFQEGNRNLEKQEYGAAIARFQAVDRDQKGYQGVDSIIRETMDKQTRALVEALDGGQKNEQAERWSDAMKWYERALVIDPASATARERAAALGERLGLAAFEDAEVLRKRGESAKAIQNYKQALELLPRSHEKSRQAQKYLETLKP